MNYHPSTPVRAGTALAQAAGVLLAVAVIFFAGWAAHDIWGEPAQAEARAQIDGRSPMTVPIQHERSLRHRAEREATEATTKLAVCVMDRAVLAAGGDVEIDRHQWLAIAAGLVALYGIGELHRRWEADRADRAKNALGHRDRDRGIGRRAGDPPAARGDVIERR